MPIARRHRLLLWLTNLWVAMRHPVMIIRHRRKMGVWANPGWPQTYSEKVMWRKIFDHNPLFVTVTDKIGARDYVRDRLPELPQPRMLWAGRAAEDIPDEVMAGPAMVKASNGSGANFTVEGGKPGRHFIGRATRHLLAPGGNRRREEWAYWPIKGRLLAEEVLPLGGGDLPTDLKAYVAGGRVCNVWACDKLGARSLTLAADGNPLPGRDDLYPDVANALPWSARLGELTREAARLAPVLAAEFDMVRVDFLVTPDRLYAGELTIYSSGGYDIWFNPAIAAEIGEAWDLRRSWFLTQPHRGLIRLYAEALVAAEAARLEPPANKASS